LPASPGQAPNSHDSKDGRIFLLRKKTGLSTPIFAPFHSAKIPFLSLALLKNGVPAIFKKVLKTQAPRGIAPIIGHGTT
jgi:hypothetical protein